ncbi:MAG TPA: hypothetical protein VH134_06115 [Candidatus Dormibacteraeota bacterium]|nr:hypothetical protein [Candidatus Dormibacteraeota bacterium]
MSTAAPAALCWECAGMRWVPAGTGVPDCGWIACADLLDPGSAALEAQLDLVAERQRTARLSVTASLLLERHAWALATAAFAGVWTGDGMPDLGAANVAVHLDAGGFVDALRLTDPRLTPAGPGAALEPLARGLLGGHLLPLVERLAGRCVHRGRRALLCLVVDALAAAIASAANAAGAAPGEAAALNLAVAVMLGTPPALHPRLLPVDGGLVRKRAVCCLLHSERAVHCATCPHLADEETVRLMRVVLTAD